MDCEKITYDKCGEIFLTNEKNYSFLCFYCDELCYEFTKFRVHITNHLNASESPNYNSSIDFSIDPLSEIVNNELRIDNKNDNCLEYNANESLIQLRQDLSDQTTLETIINESKSTNDKNNFSDLKIEPLNEIINSELNINIQTDKNDCLELNKNESAIHSFEKNYIADVMNEILDKPKKKKELLNIYCLHCKKIFKYDCHDFKKCTEIKKAKTIRKKFNPKTNEENDVKKKQQKLGNQEDSEDEYSDDFFQNILPPKKLELPYKCCYCDRLFRLKYQLNRHIRVHINFRPFKCKLCSSAFTVKANLQKHMICMHTEDKPFACSYKGCNRKFKLKGPLKQHEKQHLPDFTLPFQCEICGKQYKSRPPLIEHKYLHTGEKPFSCNQCPKIFRSHKTLWCHKKVHSDVRKYVCKLCSRAFKQLSSLYIHMKKACPFAKNNKKNSKVKSN